MKDGLRRKFIILFIPLFPEKLTENQKKRKSFQRPSFCFFIFFQKNCEEENENKFITLTFNFLHQVVRHAIIMGDNFIQTILTANFQKTIGFHSYLPIYKSKWAKVSPDLWLWLKISTAVLAFGRESLTLKAFSMISGHSLAMLPFELMVVSYESKIGQPNSRW